MSTMVSQFKCILMSTMVSQFRCILYQSWVPWYHSLNVFSVNEYHGIIVLNHEYHHSLNVFSVNHEYHGITV